jgi:UDP-N-acetylmuramate--alanine ligase
MEEHGSVAAAHPEPEPDLSRPRAIHLIGVGGSGINPLASILAEMGHRVTGSDLKESAGLDRLRSQGVEVVVGNDAGHVGDVELVGRSNAVPDHNVEVRAARARGLAVLSRADLLAAMCRQKRTLAIGGTHGKTTTAAMTALAMVETGLQPSYLVGGDVNEIGSGAVWDDDGEWFVVEADQSDPAFLRLGAEAAVVTSIERSDRNRLDRPDPSEGLDASVAGFAELVRPADALRLCCLDDPGAARLAAAVGAVTYGTEPGADWWITDHAADGVGSRFAVRSPDGDRLEVRLHVPGAHNVRNATAALATTISLGGDAETAVSALGRYAGVARRFEFRGERAGITVVDDSARLPTEVRATVEAAAGGPWRRVIAVFQAHGYQRVEWLWEDFGRAFAAADVTVIVEPQPEFDDTPRPGVSGMMLVRGILDHRPRAEVAYVPDRDGLLAYLTGRLRPGDMCLVMQAGGALTAFPDELLEVLAGREGERGVA